MFADIDHGFCFKPLYHIGVSKNISITFLREKGNGRTMQLVAVIYFRILTARSCSLLQPCSPASVLFLFFCPVLCLCPVHALL